MKFSFDFDETLDHICVQKFAKELIERGIDVHVVTNNHVEYYVLETTNELNIPKNNVHFLGYTKKYIYFANNSDYIFHLDNDYQDVDEINSFTNVIGVLFDEKWKETCLKILHDNL
jgi:hypothetical protein